MRQGVHAGTGVLAWGAFASLWAWQLDGYLPNHWLGGLLLIGMLLAAYAGVTPLWVLWNRGVYRRRRNRPAPILCEVSFVTDRLGRELLIAPAIGLDPNRITVDLDETNGTKHYFVPHPKVVPHAEPAAQEMSSVA